MSKYEIDLALIELSLKQISIFLIVSQDKTELLKETLRLVLKRTALLEMQIVERIAYKYEN